MISRFLFKPYPISIHLSFKLYYALGTSIFTAVFLFFVQPFGMVINFSSSESGMLLAYSISTGATYYVIETLLPKIFPRIFLDAHWTYLHQIAFSFVILIAIIFSISMIQSLSGIVPSIAGILKYVFTIGAFVIIGFTFLDERFLLRQRLGNYKSFTIAALGQTEAPLLQISGQSSREQLSIPLQAFLYTVAEGNYVSVYWMQNEKLQRSIIRQTIKVVQKQVATRNEIVQTHRSYLVNRLNIASVKGNKNGMMISMKHISHTVPLSRSFVDKVDVSS